jgi:hypothetical protein
VHCHAATENRASSASWDGEIRSSDPSFDSRQAPVARGFFLGDYEGLGTDGTSFFPFFEISSAADHASISPAKSAESQTTVTESPRALKNGFIEPGTRLRPTSDLPRAKQRLGL